MDKLITEELVRQIRLMNFDGSKTLYEQNQKIDSRLMPQKSDRLGSSTDYGAELSRLNKRPLEIKKFREELSQNPKKQAKLVFDIITKQIEGNGLWFSSWGTDEEAILSALEQFLVTNQGYEELCTLIYKKYPELMQSPKPVMSLIMMEFSPEWFWSDKGNLADPLGGVWHDKFND
jgi:hypothetical protein